MFLSEIHFDLQVIHLEFKVTVDQHMLSKILVIFCYVC